MEFQGLISRRMVILFGNGHPPLSGDRDFLRSGEAATHSIATDGHGSREGQSGNSAGPRSGGRYRIIPEKNLFGTTTNVVADKQAIAVTQQGIEQLIELKGTVAGEGQYGLPSSRKKGHASRRL